MTPVKFPNRLELNQTKQFSNSLLGMKDIFVLCCAQYKIEISLLPGEIGKDTKPSGIVSCGFIHKINHSTKLNSNYYLMALPNMCGAKGSQRDFIVKQSI
jgi:hypothetical protein